MAPRSRHRGYVLLLTLMMLAIAAVALAGVCREALQRTVLATRAQEDLQRRWGTMSCRAALLPKASKVLALPRGKNDDTLLSETRLSMRLGGQSLTLIFGDEQSKANINLMHALAKQHGGVDRAVRELSQLSLSPVRVDLRPLPGEFDESAETEDGETNDADAEEQDEPIDVEFEPVYETWGQVFADPAPEALLQRRGSLPSVTSQLTCWGDGAINVRRASRESIEKTCANVLGMSQVAKLISLREKDPEFDLWEALDGLNLPESKRDACDLLLTDESTCFSLWIVTRTGNRQWYDLSVAESAGRGMAGARVFSW